MKSLIFFLLLLLAAKAPHAQVTCGNIAMPEEWNFDVSNTPFDYLLQIDTISNPGNTWQIGAPHKSIVSSAFSSPDVIITDTSLPYPPNDTSVFIFRHIDQGGYSYHHSAELAGYYKVNSDTLNDFGTIEVSPDKGNTWINLVTDTTYSSYYHWLSPKPTLTGNSAGWQNFWVMLADLGNVFNIEYGDTILIRFTFISDAIDNHHDGLAFDNFQFCDGWEGIKEIRDNSMITVYPNPTDGELFIIRQHKSAEESVEIYDYTGQALFKDPDFTAGSVDTRALNLPGGVYFLKYSDSKMVAVKTFIVER